MYCLQCCNSSVRIQFSRSFTKKFHLYTPLFKKRNHYDSLELTQKATQVEVKEAYFRLSKVYHPDRNKGSEDAAEKFREVKSAYEVLGNFKLRKLYDKGMIHTAGPEFADQVPTEEEVEDDPQTKFYKQRMKRSEAPTGEGEAIQFDYDKWTREQYSRSFGKKQEAKQTYERMQAKRVDEDVGVKTERTVLMVIALMMLVGVIFSSATTSSDKDKPAPIKPS